VVLVVDVAVVGVGQRVTAGPGFRGDGAAGLWHDSGEVHEYLRFAITAGPVFRRCSFWSNALWRSS